MSILCSLSIKNLQGFSGKISFEQTTGLIGKEATGKTAFFRALSIIRALILGCNIPSDFHKYFADNTEIAAEFKLGDYHFWYTVGLGTDKELAGNVEWRGSDPYSPACQEKASPQIRFERLECKWPGNKKRELLADAKSGENIYQVFGPQTKQKLFLEHKRSGARTAAWVERQVNYKQGSSFLFSKFMFKKYEEASEAAKAAFPTEGLRQLLDWAAEHWLMLASHPAKESMLVKYCGSWHIIRKTRVDGNRYVEGTELTKAEWDSLQDNLKQVNQLLLASAGATLKIRSILGTEYQQGFGSIETIVVEHHGKEIPIDEANDSLTTLAQLCWMLLECNVEDNLVAIDDLDKNINDELLRALIRCFKAAKGQVIFTSLSTSPLRTLDWRETWFTQSNVLASDFAPAERTTATGSLLNRYISEHVQDYNDLEDLLVD